VYIFSADRQETLNKTFTAIDFETAQGYRWSICQVGLVRYENGLILKELNLLVQPPDNYYWDQFSDLHGLSAQDTVTAPTFGVVWPLIQTYIEGQCVVAHNGFGFDFVCLRESLAFYGLNEPDYDKHCTYKLYRDNLASLCSKHEIPLNHHDALSDARACAELFLRWRE